MIKIIMYLPEYIMVLTKINRVLFLFVCYFSHLGMEAKYRLSSMVVNPNACINKESAIYNITLR